MSNVSTPLSYQTTMPEYPDVSYESWANQFGGARGNRLGHALTAWANGHPDYSTWRTNTLDQYNAQMSAYNTWLQSGAGIRASAESGGYNPSYFDAGNKASASPLNYQDVADNSGLSEMAQGISGIFQFAQAFASMRMLGAQVAGQQLKNKAQEITNRFLEKKLSLQNDNLGFQADKRQFDLETLFYPRWSKRPELWSQGVFSPYGRGTYDLRDVPESFSYQRQSKDLDFLQAGIDLRKSQEALTNASKREKDWFRENVFEIQKDILLHTRDILKGTYDFQKTEQNLRKAGIIAGIGVNVINAAVNAIKAFVPGIQIGGNGRTTVQGGSQSPFVDPFDMIDMYPSGL